MVLLMVLHKSWMWYNLHKLTFSMWQFWRIGWMLWWLCMDYIANYFIAGSFWIYLLQLIFSTSTWFSLWSVMDTKTYIYCCTKFGSFLFMGLNLCSIQSVVLLVMTIIMV